MIVAFEAYNLCNLLLVNTLLKLSFLASFQVVSNRLWAHTKQEKGHCVRIRSSERFELVLHRKKGENRFETRFFSLQNEWEFISKWWHTRSLQLFQVRGRCGRDFFKVL